jgi:oligopeptide/dipeptide ABC transporter ATP-binding protein
VRYRRRRFAADALAVDRVDLTIHTQETVGIVGESGSGKSTIGRAILGLAPVSAGAVRFAGLDITHASSRMRRSLAADLQVVFQDPYSSFNRARTIGQSLREMLRAGKTQALTTVDQRVSQMLDRVALPERTSQRYPGELSGGQLQRAAIARALIVNPRLVICDEPVSALDLSVQAQVLNLVRDLQQQLGASYLFITHDLAVVRNVSHRAVVLYSGRVMEQGPTDLVYATPLHPFTQALKAAAPVPDPEVQRARRREVPDNGLQSPTKIVGGDNCPFAARCPHATGICRTKRPALEKVADGWFVACHRWREVNRVDREMN